MKRLKLLIYLEHLKNKLLNLDKIKENIKCYEDFGMYEQVINDDEMI